jgi:hypothetical protein
MVTNQKCIHKEIKSILNAGTHCYNVDNLTFKYRLKCTEQHILYGIKWQDAGGNWAALLFVAKLDVIRMIKPRITEWVGHGIVEMRNANNFGWKAWRKDTTHKA